jgi:hypothetical protein
MRYMLIIEGDGHAAAAELENKGFVVSELAEVSANGRWNTQRENKHGTTQARDGHAPGPAKRPEAG